MTGSVLAPAAARRTSAAAAGAGPSIRPTSVLQVALALLLVGNLGRIPFLDLGDREAPILVNDIAVLSVVAAGALLMLRRRSMTLTDAALAALAFIAVGGITAVAAMPRFGLSAPEVVASLAYLARWSAYFALYVVTVNCVRVSDAGAVWRALERTMLIFAAFGIVQSAFLPDFAQMVYPESRPYIDYDPQGHRLMSTVLEPNIAAAMILTVLVVQLSQLATGARVSLWKPALLLLALVLTLSRSGLLAFMAAGTVVMVARGVNARMARLAALSLVALVAALPKLLTFAASYSKLGFTDGSALARLVSWQRAFAVFVEHPWFGIGFNTYGFVQERRGIERLGGAAYSSEGGLLFIAVMTGIVGLALYCGMLWYIVKQGRAGWRDLRATPWERGLCLGAAAATVAVVVHSVFVNSLLTPFVMEPLWVLWGLTAVIVADLRRRPASAVTPSPGSVG